MPLHNQTIPSPGESITEVEIGVWLKQNGDFVQMDDPLCEIETDKATLPLIAEVAGSLQIVLEQGATAGIGDVVCRIDTDVKPAMTVEPESPGPVHPHHKKVETQFPVKDLGYSLGHAGPAARKLMDEKGLQEGTIPGSGPGGRILKEDVLKTFAPSQPALPETKAESKPVAKPRIPEPKPPTVPVPEATGQREVNRQRISRLRRKLAERLVSVKNETAMLTTFNEVDMQAIFDLRRQYKQDFEKNHGVRLGFMGFFVKACCEALREFPALNSQIEGEKILSFNFVDMGIAVSAPKGLMVPVIRNAECLNIARIETEIRRLAERARDNKLSLEEMEGGTFSITNGGIFGSMLSTPILNPPQAAILGMHNIVDRPVAIEGQVFIRPVMYLALSYDHRLVDGQQSVSFLVRIKQLLETPARILLGV